MPLNFVDVACVEELAGACRVGIRAQAASPALAAAEAINVRRDSRAARMASKEGRFMAAHANVATHSRLAQEPPGTLRMRLSTLLAIAIFTAFSRLASAQAPAQKPAQPDLARMHSDAPGIAWFDGDVDAAFKAAQASNKPVLLYWGAQWCPPCKQLKSAVFSRPDFIEKSKLFVAVYLDGDLPDAQKWGDVFRVTGYPTVVVLKPDRTEITRLT